MGGPQGGGPLWNPGGSSAPAQTTVTVSSTQNNLNLTGITDVRLDPTASFLLTGVVADTTVRMKFLRNVSPYIIILQREASTSTAANRFQCEDPSGGHFALMPGDACWIVYDSTDSRWTIISVRSVWSDIGRGTLRWLRPNAASAPLQEVPFSSGTGTWVCPAPTAASLMESKFRNRIASAAGATSVAGIGSSATILHSLPGNGTYGGFGIIVGFGFEVLPDQVDDTIVGLSATASPGAGNPYTVMANTAAFTRDNGETTWNFSHNDGSGSCTKVPLTGYTVTAMDLLRGIIWWDRTQSGKMSYALWKDNDLTVTPAIGDVSTNLPASAMYAQWRTTNRSANSRTIMFDEWGFWMP